MGARMPGGACQGSELRGGGGRWGPRQRAARGSRETLAPLGPPSRRVRPRWLFCAAAAHGGGGRVSSPPWPALASVPGPRGQLQCPSVSECPPAAQAACESSDSTFKQRGRGFKPPSCLLQDLQTSQGRREGRGTHMCARKGGKVGSWGRSCIPQKLLSTHQELGIVLGPRETLRVRTDGIPALRALTLQQERSNSQLRTHVYV